MKSDSDMEKGEIQPGQRGRLWIWFVAGFLVVFVCLSLSITMYSLLPSGNTVVRCKLWRYYVIEFRRVLSSANAIGPASGNSSALATTVLQHFLCSLAAGAGAVGSGWAYYKVRGR